MTVRAIVQLDDQVVAVLRDGTVVPLLPGGHPRPGCSHATAQRTKPPSTGAGSAER